MERGCTLLLDECDLGSNKLLALQPVLEGKGVYLKKVNKWVTPKEGFNVIKVPTANTKGKGSEDGRFIGTNILNDHKRISWREICNHYRTTICNKCCREKDSSWFYEKVW